eukprot:TRINITY_DN6420_c1_g1_i1.p1 TRINITY_DN6420_c1_g1~~TRINITY_DN6420_c1_g1_i1.p1  ORF type:complete len:300 (+),score=45.93 TRINITY_DN6420_c1_g1_i1:37-900(+)
MEKTVFITEVGVPEPGPPGPVVSEQLRVVDQSKRLVKNIYDFPSVQNLKVENGHNMPFRYKIKPPGRAPVFRMAQGKRLTNQSMRMGRHHMIFNTGIATGGGGLPCEEVRKEMSCRLPIVRDGGLVRVAAEGGEEAVPRLPVAKSVPPSLCSSVMAASTPEKIVRERLSKHSISGIEARSGIELSRAPPTPNAPPPIPNTPIASTIVSNSSVYDNLTSVSLRTPQTSTCSSKLQSGINRLTRDLLQEEAYKQEVQKELQSLKQRQEAIIAALTREEREELQRNLSSA